MFPLIELATSLINKLFPDKTKAAELQAQLLQMQAEGSLKEIEAQYNLAGQQIDVDKQEASVGQSLTGWQAFFVSGPRPYLLWVCGGAFSWAYVLQPLLTFILAELGHTATLPTLDISQMMPVLLGLLGLGGLRTYEKVQGVNNLHG